MLRSGRLISMQTSLGCSSRRSSRPLTQTMASSASRWPTSVMVRGNTHTSMDDTRSSRTKVAISSPRLVYLRTTPVTTPPTQRTSPSLAALAELGDGGVDVAGEGRLHALERVVAQVEPEHLLLERQPHRLGELLVGDRDPGVVEDRLAAAARGHRTGSSPPGRPPAGGPGCGRRSARRPGTGPGGDGPGRRRHRP